MKRFYLITICWFYDDHLFIVKAENEEDARARVEPYVEEKLTRGYAPNKEKYIWNIRAIDELKLPFYMELGE